jgi:dienelactone hydrolase
MLRTNTGNFLYFSLELGGKKFAVIGACWGAWANFHIASEIELVCGVNWHPSVHMEELVHKKS